jgi:hypothetical protein
MDDCHFERILAIRGFQWMGPYHKDAVLLAVGSQFWQREPTIAVSFAPKHCE